MMSSRQIFVPLSTTPPRSLTRQSLDVGAAYLADRHPQFAALLHDHGPPPLWGRRPGFATLVRIILEQQVSLAAARTMYRWLEQELGVITPAAFRARGIIGLRELGLTRQKATYIHSLSVAILDQRLDLAAIARAPDAQGRAALLAMPGIGPWTVDIYYLMALRRPDIWPQGDLALAQALQHVFALPIRPSAVIQQTMAAAWTPWRSVAARLLWQAYLAGRIRPA
jgi:DNA-3-methyladenine glycosylase II